MFTVWKYTFQVDDGVWIEMPADAQLLHAESYYGVMNLWARVDPSRPRVNRHILVRGTGHPIDDEPHISTVAVWPLVWHVFDGGEEGAGVIA